MASEHLSHNIPHIPCHWEALKQPHSSRHPGRGTGCQGWHSWDGLSSPEWLILTCWHSCWHHHLAVALQAFPIPSQPIPSSSSPLLFVSLQRDYSTNSAFFSSIPSSVGDTGEKVGSASSRGKGENCCFLERESK